MNNDKKKAVQNKYKDYLECSDNEIPSEHLTNEGSLKCFFGITKNINGEIKRLRCKKQAKLGTLFCEKHKIEETSVIVKKDEKNPYQNKLSDLFESYLNDPSLVDHKQDLATLRTLLTGYINKITASDPLSKKDFVHKCKLIVDSDAYSGDLDRYDALKDVFESQSSLFDDKTIKNINELVNNIRRGIETIQKLNVQDSFILQPEGFKIFLRAIVDILKMNVLDKELLLKIQTHFLDVSVITQGNLQKISENVIDVKKNE